MYIYVLMNTYYMHIVYIYMRIYIWIGRSSHFGHCESQGMKRVMPIRIQRIHPVPQNGTIHRMM